MPSDFVLLFLFFHIAVSNGNVMEFNVQFIEMEKRKLNATFNVEETDTQREMHVHYAIFSIYSGRSCIFQSIGTI